jgi:hypothetical protein
VIPLVLSVDINIGDLAERRDNDGETGKFRKEVANTSYFLTLTN